MASVCVCHPGAGGRRASACGPRSVHTVLPALSNLAEWVAQFIIQTKVLIKQALSP